MGLFDFLLRLVLPAKPTAARARPRRKFRKRPRPKPRLVPLRRALSRHRSRSHTRPRSAGNQETLELPYRFARLGVHRGTYLDLSRDGNSARLTQLGLPHFDTPEKIAGWLDLPIGEVAWLIHRFSGDDRPQSERDAHYHYHWIRKRSGGQRLIEAPKRRLKAVQTKILREILDKIPVHSHAHGFAAGKSIVTNARPHVAKRVLLKFDLENFYASVSFARVVAIFRSVGYCREAAIWLARLTTSALPTSIPFPRGSSSAVLPFLHRHLPQGAPTSPALANLSAYSLDVRLSGISNSFAVNYTRYADDLTFSGPSGLLRALPTFIPLVTGIIRSERFRVNRRKRKVIRDNQRQVVTGVVVNERTNVCRRDYDRLKAILNNCVRHGPSSQNRDRHEDFASHLQGRIANLSQLNAARGLRLLELYGQIDWRR